MLGVIRYGSLAVFVGGIAGMIVSSIADSTAAALTFGLITAAAALCLMVSTATVNALERRRPAAPTRLDEADAAGLEAQIQALVRDGADEDRLRALVRAARGQDPGGIPRL
ncbi:MAG: hypothetical protein ACKVWR_06310 [Acidimicrobiales bacterium]